MNLKLVVQSKTDCEPEELLLTDSSHGIGRMHDNDLSIQSDNVSGYHAELNLTPEGHYTVSDLNSTNGTFLNGSRVSSPERVKSGDLLKLGNLQLAIEEHIEQLPQAENESDPGPCPQRIISLKDHFGVAKEEHSNTYPITPIRPPASPGNAQPVYPAMAEKPTPVPVNGKANGSDEAARAREIEQAKEAERAKEIERAKEAERAREAERAKEIERAKEAERAKEIERAREAERAKEIERAREAERTKEIERAREAERAKEEAARAEANLREEQTRANLEEFRSRIQSLTTELGNAMQEINRLKSINAQQSSALQEMNGRAAEAETLKQQIARDREDHAALRSEVADLKEIIAQKERAFLEATQEKDRAASQLNSRLRGQVSEMKASLGKFEEERNSLTQSNSQLRQELEEARLAGGEAAGNEANLRRKNAELVERIRDLEGENATLATRIEEATSSLSENETRIGELQQQLRESESRSEAAREQKAELTRKLEATEQRRMEAEETVRQWQEKLAALEREAQTAREQLDTSEKKTSELGEALAQATRVRGELEAARHDLESRLNDRDTRIADLIEASEELESSCRETAKEKEQLLTDLRLTREGLSEALHSTHRRLGGAKRNLNTEIYLRKAAEKQLREAAADLESLRNGPEALVLSSDDSYLNRMRALTPEKGEDRQASEAGLEGFQTLEADSPSGGSVG